MQTNDKYLNSILHYITFTQKVQHPFCSTNRNYFTQNPSFISHISLKTYFNIVLFLGWLTLFYISVVPYSLYSREICSSWSWIQSIRHFVKICCHCISACLYDLRLLALAKVPYGLLSLSLHLLFCILCIMLNHKIYKYSWRKCHLFINKCISFIWYIMTFIYHLKSNCWW